MGNSDNTPNDGKLSLDTSAPLWDAILTDISRGHAHRRVQAADGLQTATVDAFTGLKPGPFTTKTVKELFIKGTVPTQRETSRVAQEIDKASGLLWQDGCVGPEGQRGFFNMAEVEAGHPTWQKADRNWGARAARGRRRPRRLRGARRRRTSTAAAFFPFGRSWGAKFAPTELCPLAPVVTPPPACDPLLLPPEATPCPPVQPDQGNPDPKPSKAPKP